MRPVIALLLVSGILTMGNAQSDTTCPDPKAGKISVTGTATVTETPNIATVYLSVSVVRPSAKEARQVAANTTTAVFNALGAVSGIDGSKDVTTADFSLNPNYIWDQTTSTNKVNGYTFTQSITVKITNLTSDTLSAVVDASVKAGGNNLQLSSIQMALSPEVKRSAMDRARSLAVEDAASTAEILAQAARVSLGAIKSLTDSNVAPPMPMYSAGAVMGAADTAQKESTPVNIGTTDVTATVMVDYAIISK